MPSDAPRQPSQPARIDLPDQLQQSRRQPASRPAGSTAPAGGAGGAGEASPPRQGILGQLETERAHD